MKTVLLFLSLLVMACGAPRRVLFVITGHRQLGDTEKETGYWLSEVTHPFAVLNEAGIAVEFGSPGGGRVHMDPRSRDLDDPVNRAFVENEDRMMPLYATRPLAALDPDNYDAVFFAGGHGAMWDFPRNEEIQRLVRGIWEGGGTVAAVCHGPAAFVGLELSDGRQLIAGKRLTGFTNAEEDRLDLGAVVPFYLETMLRELGGIFEGADPYAANVVVDGRLITGQNPASSRGVGEALAAQLVTPPRELTVVAESPRQWTGVTVSGTGRIFVNFPRWSNEVPMAVAELLPNGVLRAYPNETINTWNPDLPPGDRFVCVQSVVVDSNDDLWVLDPANPRFEGVVKGGPKLVRIDLETGKIARTIHFHAPTVRDNSYLNDVRIDNEAGFAYISDSGDGAIIVVSLESGKAYRRLDHHPSTDAEEIEVLIDGEPWLRPDGSRPRVHADGIALDPANEMLYYRALTSRFVYCVPASALRNLNLSARQLGRRVKVMANTGPCDGMLYGPDGWLYLTAIDEDAVERWHPVHGLEVAARDPRLAWPDTLARGPDGAIYVTSSQIHRQPDPGEPYRLFKFTP